jgi:DNA-binding beta-propeller fold protein YncE
MKKKQDKNKSSIMVISRLLVAILLFTAMFFGAISADVVAAVETTFLYNLSNFSGPIPYNWAKISVDEERNEIYVVDIRERDITIFNEQGMEIYRFGEDSSLGTVVDVAVKRDGNILVLSRGDAKSPITLCNFRGEPIAKLALKNLPSDFSAFSPDRMVYRQERLYLLDSLSLRIVVTDPNGLFQTGYDLGSLVEVKEEKRIETDIGGFSVDREGNMLFTIPVFFSAYKLSPDGKLAGFGQPGSAPGRFNVVGGIVADDRGYYYVADRLKSAVLVFDKGFQFQFEFGYRGPRPENLIGPRNLALDAKGRLYVSQLKSRGVSVFEITHRP